MTTSNRYSTYTSVSAGSDNRDGASGSDKKKDMWGSLLESVASGRRLPERNLLVFGGTVDSQREFLESLSHADLRRNLDRQQKLPPVANNFALGYTYYDVLDADQEDILARISLYLLSQPSPSFSSLIQPLLTPESIPNTLIVILLDWSQPWLWLRQLREWILLLRTVLVSLSPECKEVMEDAMGQWRERGRGGPLNLDGTTSAVDGDALPPGPGEWEDALGLPLCVVCQNSEKTDILEKTQGWKDDEFDLILQYLRTVLVKHGGSLIYTTPGVPSELPTLVHACLGVTSLLKRQPLKPEVIKRTEVVVPSNWDSWTKILVVREGFEVDKVSDGWSKDLQRPFPLPSKAANGHSNGDRQASAKTGETQTDGEGGPGGEEEGDGYEDPPDSAVSQYERAIRDPGLDALVLAGQATYPTTHLEVETENVQAFLTEQLGLLDQMRQKDEARREKEAKEAAAKGSRGGGNSASSAALAMLAVGSEGAAGAVGDPAEVISSHIGPVQFNIGGIQVDADDMLERIKNRHGFGDEASDTETPAAAEEAPRVPDSVDTDKMSAFFAGLMNRQSQTGKT